ncbi:MAG: hypothetical protein J6Y55_05725 [Bacteroidales bacterium]|nr:hypothetical protein [Bacteroidales bacterium]
MEIITKPKAGVYFVVLDDKTVVVSVRYFRRDDVHIVSANRCNSKVVVRRPFLMRNAQINAQFTMRNA